MILTFDAKHALQLLALSKSTERRTPIMDQLVQPGYWRDDIEPTRRAMLDAEVKEYDIALSARAEDVDHDKIEIGLILVGDQGVYLMSQAPIEEVRGAGLSHVVYAREVDPTTLPVNEWWAAKRKSFGGDDGTLLLTEDQVKAGCGTGSTLRIDLTPTRIGILPPV